MCTTFVITFIHMWNIFESVYSMVFFHQLFDFIISIRIKLGWFWLFGHLLHLCHLKHFGIFSVIFRYFKHFFITFLLWYFWYFPIVGLFLIIWLPTNQITNTRYSWTSRARPPFCVYWLAYNVPCWTVVADKNGGVGKWSRTGANLFLKCRIDGKNYLFLNLVVFIHLPYSVSSHIQLCLCQPTPTVWSGRQISQILH